MVYCCFTHILWDLNGFNGSEWALNCFNIVQWEWMDVYVTMYGYWLWSIYGGFRQVMETYPQLSSLGDRDLVLTMVTTRDLPF